MAKADMSVRLDAPAERVWNVIRAFDALRRWHPAIARTEEGRAGATTRRSLPPQGARRGGMLDVVRAGAEFGGLGAEIIGIVHCHLRPGGHIQTTSTIGRVLRLVAGIGRVTHLDSPEQARQAWASRRSTDPWGRFWGSRAGLAWARPSRALTAAAFPPFPLSP